ncbi:MAG: hypothetical protein AUJ48_03970 [Deltaproteobacteria bacterium CG1_02_45_11]|nr:MAG: hypothetical protein AUJ48_03970 [Deltaproteobacteria bacterium CG1_02_45_11]
MQRRIFKFDNAGNKGVYLILFFIIVTGFLIIRCSFIFHESLWPDEALYMFIGENLATDPLNLKDEMGRPFFQNPPFFMPRVFSTVLFINSTLIDKPAIKV